MAAKRPSLWYQISIALVAGLMSLTLLSSIAGFWKLDLPARTLAFYAAIGIAVGWLVWLSPRLALALTLVAGAGVGLGARYLPEWTLYIHSVLDAWQALWRHLRIYEFETQFEPILVVIFMTAISLAAGILIMRECLSRGQAFWSLAGGLIVFGVEWSWYYEKSSSYFMGFGVLGFLLWVLGQAALRDARWAASGRKIGYPSHIVTPVVAVLITAIFAAVMPNHFEAVNLGTIGEKAREAFPVLAKLRGGGGAGSRFSMKSTGFAPLNDLGGPVTLDNGPALRVTTDARLDRTLYLRGATYREYTGQKWLAGGAEALSLPQSGNVPSELGSDVMTDQISYQVQNSISLGYTIFNVLEPDRVEGLKGTLKADTDRNLWSDKLIGLDTPYQVLGREPLYSADQIRLLSTSSPGENMKPYLQLPQGQLNRVAQLAKSITGKAEHPYDKAIALEDFLRTLEYRLDVPAAPANRDFVDFFLFDLGKGYCVYSATAMAVMLRQEGIPSRLVEGFALPPSAHATPLSGGQYAYDVTKDLTHAWVEGYFPGYGWVTFDPTPRADIPAIDRSTPLPRSSYDLGSSSGDTPEYQDTPKDPKDLLEDPAGGAGGGTAKPTREWPWGLTMAAALLGLAYLAYRRLKVQGHIQATEEGRVVQEVWLRTSSLLAQFGTGRQPHQTATEYARAVGARWPALAEPAEQAAADYTAVRYSPPDQPVAPDKAGRLREFWIKVEDALFARFGWRRYLWRRLRWRRGNSD